MATFRDSDPSDPMYNEGPQSYSPHWGRAFLKSKKPPPNPVDGSPTTRSGFGMPERIGRLEK